MGVDTKKRSAPPLPAPTETNSTILTRLPSEVGTDVSKPGDEKSSYSLPDDGTPVTIRTGHRASKSQTSLLIEYFEGGKPSSRSGANHRKPSVRVRVTPSSKHRSKGSSDRDRIKITQTKSRKASPSRRSAHVSDLTRSELDGISLLSGDMEDASSYASATEESTVSRNPIDIEIDRGDNARRRRPASPLIPAADSKLSSYPGGTMSEISAIPADSFLDGSGGATSFGTSELKSGRSRSPSRTSDYLVGAAAGLAGATALDKLRSKSRDDRDRDRISVSKSRDRDKDRKHRPSKSRTSSLSKEEKYVERAKSPRRRSKGPNDSVVSAADSSVVSSAFAPASHRSIDQHSVRSTTSKASSINNPKLLETVEDAIRRLILPELNALKREQSRHKSRRDSTTSSTTTASRDDYVTDRRRSGATDKLNMANPRDSMRSKESRDREARNDFDDSSALSHDSIEDEQDLDDTPIRSADRLKSIAAAGAALGVAGVAAHDLLLSPSDDKQRSRRRRRAEMRSRGSDLGLEDEDSELGPPGPPMPLMSEINPSEVTRASILTADTDRPHSATEELTPGRDLPNDLSSPSRSSTPTPTKVSTTLQSLGTQHANISHGDLKRLPQERTGQWDEYIIDDNGKRVPSRANKQYEEEDEYDDNDDSRPAYAPDSPYDYYSTQDVPPPLKYVPYQPERRGLSPIPSVSGYTEAGSELNHESRATHRTAESVSSISHEFADDRSMRSAGVEQSQVSQVESHIESPIGSELEKVASGEAVRAVAQSPDFVHPQGIESNVASLVDGSMLDASMLDASMLDGSVLTATSSVLGGQAYHRRESMATLEEEEHQSRDLGTPTKRSVASQHSHHDYADEREGTPASGSQRSRHFEEYDLDEYGRKVPQNTYRQSPTMSEAAITSAAVGAAARVIREQNAAREQQIIVDNEDSFQPAGVGRHQSFKERTRNGPRPGIDTASAEELVRDDDHHQPKMGFSGLPDLENPMPDGDWNDDDMLTNPSLLGGEGGRDEEGDHWAGDLTPRQHPQYPEDDVDYHDLDGHASPELPHQHSGHELAMAGAAAAAAGMALAQSHSRQPSQEHDEWRRTSEDRKRDTLVTNPYEDSSPIANLPDINNTLLGAAQGFDSAGFGNLYNARSPLGHKVDEGYISQGPNKSPDLQGANKGKGVDFDVVLAGAEDPFYTAPNHTRHLSGMSQGMGSPMYDASTGTGIERIESKDIIALMQHLMVRDAQRSARDTEILVTLVRSATEMRNNFEDIKRLLADTEDVIITEVKENTEKTVQRAINGPRPYPGSMARSIHGGSQAGTINDDINAKKRSIFRRALKGLSAKGANDLGRIEDMLMQLLTEVDVLKAQTAPGNPGNPASQSYEHLEPEVQDEQDHGYEPEGMAGTSTASHASQSGFLSIQSRGTSVKPGYDRRVSGHRISTVPEDNEEEYDHGLRVPEDHLMTPMQEQQQRGSSVPLATPPGAAAAAQTQASMSNEHTPRTEESSGGKKHKSGRSSWFRIPKISRWSETTASSGVAESRHSKQSSKDETGNFPTGPSRSGSLDHYQDNYQFAAPPQAIQSDKLHTGFSETDLPYHHEEHPHINDAQMYGAQQVSSPPTTQAQTQTAAADPNWALLAGAATPEDPKYKAHRDSLNLVHPQPRQGQTERFKAALETQALGFDSPLSPRSADWAGSATSLNRFAPGGNQQGGEYGYQQQWTSSPAAGNVMATSGGPPRPPKELLDGSGGATPPPQNKRVSKLQKKTGSPLPHHSVESGYGTMTHGVPTASYISQGMGSRDSAGSGHSGEGSPRLENRNLSVAQAGGQGVNRRPSGPRPMTPTGRGYRTPEEARKRDTFGTLASQDSETF
ncbi:hypothetical protein C8A05DRAFT_33144 [Staphylotrichum tortipilum]|uniref:DUF3824 domain-containing protein n=1 Tax=Staphylotrichum tortipilum TaxID=2831512 RepID=A0AAN6MLI7_9PEZI|nr:hypothetical protein C8A05DRAFT_33144 [Staphylotrichum longicolle]